MEEGGKTGGCTRTLGRTEQGHGGVSRRARGRGDRWGTGTAGSAGGGADRSSRTGPVPAPHGQPLPPGGARASRETPDLRASSEEGRGRWYPRSPARTRGALPRRQGVAGCGAGVTSPGHAPAFTSPRRHRKFSSRIPAAEGVPGHRQLLLSQTERPRQGRREHPRCSSGRRSLGRFSPAQSGLAPRGACGPRVRFPNLLGCGGLGLPTP